jgi:hypothetical protein
MAANTRSPAYCSTVHVDVMTVPQPLDKVGDLARCTQAAGFSGLLFTETGRTAYLNVAVAFPRSPFVTAATAWELQEATGGKFRLGLGTQAHSCRAALWHGFRASGPRLRD